MTLSVWRDCKQIASMEFNYVCDIACYRKDKEIEHMEFD